MAIIDRIKFDGIQNGSPWLIYKYPSEQFVTGSQLIVSQGQEALFFKGGEILQVFGAGTRTLTTGNLPVLKKLVNFPFGGRTPFVAEIYYVNKTVNLSLKWGTATPIPLEDPKYGLLLNVGARGQYGITIRDSRLFVSRIIGVLPNGSVADHIVVLKYFSGLINTKIKAVIASFMIQKRISFLEISQHLSELSEAFKEVLSDEFERFGIDLVHFYCESIAPKPEEYKKLQGYKEELALGNGFYQQRRTFDILEKMADNPSAGTVANAGVGLGMGLGAANAFGNMFSSIGRTSPIAEAACPHCGSTVHPGMKFCGECGKTLINGTCPSCGFENRPGMKFCGNCGQRL